MLNDVALFVEIVRSGSLSKASKKLSVPANTLSRRLINLEKRLGTSLILRSTQALRCTADGERLFESCSAHIDILNLKINSLQSALNDVSGKVRVQVPSGFFNYPKNDFLCKLLEVHSELEIEIIVSDEEKNLIEEGIDLMFHFGEPRKGSYIIRRLSGSELGLYASPSYLAENGLPERPEEMELHDCFHSTAENSVEIKRRDGSDAKEITLCKRLKTRSIPALINAAEHGVGIVLMNTSCMINNNSLTRVLPEFIVEGEPLFAAYSNHHALSACARVVMDYAFQRSEEFDVYPSMPPHLEFNHEEKLTRHN